MQLQEQYENDQTADAQEISSLIVFTTNNSLSPHFLSLSLSLCFTQQIQNSNLLSLYPYPFVICFMFTYQFTINLDNNNC